MTETVSLIVTRMSVCAGDDCTAPNTTRLTATKHDDTLEQIRAFAKAIAPHIPRITGGHAAWVLSSRRPLAVLAQEWGLLDPKSLISTGLDRALERTERGEIRLHLSYLVQQDPSDVFQMLCRVSMADEVRW